MTIYVAASPTLYINRKNSTTLTFSVTNDGNPPNVNSVNLLYQQDVTTANFKTAATAAINLDGPRNHRQGF